MPRLRKGARVVVRWPQHAAHARSGTIFCVRTALRWRGLDLAPLVAVRFDQRIGRTGELWIPAERIIAESSGLRGGSRSRIK